MEVGCLRWTRRDGGRWIFFWVVGVVVWSGGLGIGVDEVALEDEVDPFLVVESFYLEAIAALTGNQKMKQLTRSELEWILARQDMEGNEIGNEAVREFFCKERSMKGFCERQRPGVKPEWASRQDDNEPLRVVTKPCEPFSFCVPNETITYGPNDSTGPRGYSIDLWNEIAKKLEIENYVYTCVQSTSYMLERLAAGDYDVATACISVKGSRLASMELSRVYYYSGLEVMIMRPGKTHKDPLSMLDPFTWDVWICMLISVLVVGVFTWLFERHHNSHMPVALWTGLAHGQWHSWTTFLQNPFINYRSTAARLTSLSFLIVSFVLVSTYTANLAAFLTRASLDVPILSRKDLVGRRVGTSGMGTTSYDWLLAQQSSTVIPIEDNDERFQALYDKEVDALVWDSPALRYRAFLDCDKVVVGDVFSLEDYAMAVNRDHRELSNEVDKAIVDLKEQKFNDELYGKWFQGGTECTATLDQNVETNETDAVSLDTTWVLFAFLAGTLILSSCIAFEEKIRRILKIRGGERRGEEHLESQDSERSVTFAEKLAGMGSTAELVGNVPQEDYDY